MRKGKLWSFALIMLLVLSTALAACSGGDDKEGSSDKDKDAADTGGNENNRADNCI